MLATFLLLIAGVTVAAPDTHKRFAAGADFRCDGVDDHEQIAAAIEASNDVTLLPGTYRIGESAGVVIGKPVRITAHGAVIETAATTGGAIFTVRDSFTLSGGEVRDWPGNVVRIDNTDGPVSGVTIDGVSFVRIGRTPGNGTSFPIIADANANPICNVAIRRCYFEECCGGVSFNEERLDTIEVHDCRFIGSRHNCVQLGIRDTPRHQDERRNISITDCFVDRLDSEVPRGPVIALRIYGTQSKINCNTVGPVTAGHDSDECGIFTKLTHSEVCDNVVMGGGTKPRSSGAIAIKGTKRGSPDKPAGHDMLVEGNHVIDVTMTGLRGIAIHCDDVICRDNVTHGWAYPLILTTQGSSGIRVEDNRILQMRSQYGILLDRPTSDGGGIVLRGNSIIGTHPANPQNNVFGISLRAVNELRGITIEDNTISDLRSPTGRGSSVGIELGGMAHTKIHDAAILRNMVNGCDQFLMIRDGRPRVRNVRIEDNPTRGVGVGITGQGHVRGELIIRHRQKSQ